MIKKIKISISEKVILIFVIMLGIFSLTSLMIIGEKCLFVKNYNPDDIQFDNTLCELHFNNGYIDLKDHEFKQRDIKKHFVSKYISRDYIKSTSEDREAVIKLIEKIYPERYLSHYKTQFQDQLLLFQHRYQ